MKKILKTICASLIFVMSLSFISGCGCNKPLNVKVSVTIEDSKETNIAVKQTVTKKFREPGDTPCYKKVEDKYELIENAGGVSACYDQNGNPFEKATYEYVDKLVIDKGKWVEFENKKYTDSKLFEMPENENHSLIFEFEVLNKTANTIYLEELTANDIINDQLKGESINKLTFTVSNPNIVVVEGKDYYSVEPNKKIKFTIELKNLKENDKNKEQKEFNLNLPIKIK